MYSISDIPDWAVLESTGKDADFTKTLTAEQRKCMYDSSPIAHVEKVNR